MTSSLTPLVPVKIPQVLLLIATKYSYWGIKILFKVVRVPFKFSELLFLPLRLVLFPFKLILKLI